MGPVGGTSATQGTGLTATIATIVSQKNMELTQLGVMTLGATGSAQLVLNPDGSLAAQNYSIGSTGNATFGSINGSTGTFTGTLTAQSTSAFTGLATFSGGIAATASNSTISKLTGKPVSYTHLTLPTNA